MKRRPLYLLIATLAACGGSGTARSVPANDDPALSDQPDPGPVALPPAPRTPSAEAPPADPARGPAGAAKLPFTLDQLRFQVSRNRLVARAGALHAIVPSVYRATTALGFEPSSDGRSVTVRYLDELGCMDPNEVHTTQLALEPLAARMLNGEALEAHRAGRFDAAAQGFAAASALDASFELARTNRACALNRLGRRQDALAALAPLLRDNPVLAYSKVASDPELQTLQDAPELVALRAAAPSEVTQAMLDAARAPLVGLGGRAVAVLVREQSWGSDDYQVWLHVFDARTGVRQLELTLSDFADHDHDGKTLPARRAEVDARYEQAARWLSELGFAGDAKASARSLEALPSNGRLRRSPLRIKRYDWNASGSAAWRYDVWKNERVIGHFGENRAMNVCDLTYLPSARALVVQWIIEAPEGCDNGPYTFAELIPTP